MLLDDISDIFHFCYGWLLPLNKEKSDCGSHSFPVSLSCPIAYNSGQVLNAFVLSFASFNWICYNL